MKKLFIFLLFPSIVYCQNTIVDGNGAIVGYVKAMDSTIYCGSSYRIDTMRNHIYTYFLSKQAAIPQGTTAQYFRGDFSLVTFPTTTAGFTSSTNKNFVTDAQLVIIGNTSSTNSGDNAVNSLYSGLPALKVNFSDTAGMLTNYARKSTLTTTGSLGYVSGAGGVITQATSKSTTVILNKQSGEITMNAAALAAATIVSFTLTNSTIAATDVLILNHVTTGTRGAYSLNAQCAAGSAIVYVRNNTAGSLSEAIVIRFVLMKGSIN